MNIRLYNVLTRYLIWACILISSACSYFVSWDEANRPSVGDPIDEIIKVWGEPSKIWTRDDGMTIYEYDLKKLDPSCIHYWVVRKDKIIVDFYYTGYCRPIG